MSQSRRDFVKGLAAITAAAGPYAIGKTASEWFDEKKFSPPDEVVFNGEPKLIDSAASEYRVCKLVGDNIDEFIPFDGCNCRSFCVVRDGRNHRLLILYLDRYLIENGKGTRCETVAIPMSYLRLHILRGILDSDLLKKLLDAVRRRTFEQVALYEETRAYSFDADDLV